MVRVSIKASYYCLELFVDLLVSFVRGIDLFLSLEFFLVFFVFPVASGRFVFNLKSMSTMSTIRTIIKVFFPIMYLLEFQGRCPSWRT